MFSYHALVSICYAVICSFEVEIRTANIRLNFGFTKFARSAERTNLERYEEDSNSRSKIFPLARMVSSRAQIRDCLKTGSLSGIYRTLQQLLHPIHGLNLHGSRHRACFTEAESSHA